MAHWMISTDFQVQSSMKDFAKYAKKQKKQKQKQKMLNFTIKWEGGDKGVDTHVLYTCVHEQNKKIIH